MQEMLKTVAAVIGTVEDSPRRVLELKLPSGLVSVHDVTPCESQRIVVREPSETEIGDAFI